MRMTGIDAVIEDTIVARRNMQLGLWAGMRLGYRAERLDAYAREVMEADYYVSGPDDVIEKITIDFEDRGIDCPPEFIAMELQRIERSVRAQLLAAD